MSEKTWNKLPSDVQQIFIDITPGSAEKDLRAQTMDHDFALKDVNKFGHTIITNTPEEIAIWKEAAKPLHEKWITKREATGLPAKAVFNEVVKLIKEYSK